jgi:molecular chaperone GrpE
MPSSHGTEQQEQQPQPAAAAPSGDERYAQLEDRYLRALADLDNFRKRSARDSERRVADVTDGLLRPWLEVVDSIERALQATADERAAAGLRAVHDQIRATLDRQGVARIGRPGEPFDPALHEAIGVHPTDELPDRAIVDVARPGYAVAGRIVRPAQVVVARRPQPES